jgi:DNA (cytosine-5)-methyltransferase 1
LKKKVLDLFCGAGGISMGWHQAGFEVEGVDINPQPNYPFKFYQADALTFPLDGYDVIVASPPCQAYSTTKSLHGVSHPELLEPTRALLRSTGKPYVIENVVGAPLISPIMLCGTMFGLRLFRHRLFESNILLFSPGHIPHSKQGLKAPPRGNVIPDEDNGEVWSIYGHMGGREGALKAMGIDWHMTQHETAQAIPPSYSKFIAEQIMSSS